jgi:hypothetical protein
MSALRDFPSGIILFLRKKNKDNNSFGGLVDKATTFKTVYL